MTRSSSDFDDDAPSDPLSAGSVRRAQAGDEAAREALLEAVQPILRGYFTERLGRNAAIDDLMQNTLVRLHEGLAELQKPGSLRSFLMKAALYELQDFYRGRYDMRESLYDPDVPPEQSASFAGTTTDDVPTADSLDAQRALDALSDAARRVMELRAYGYRYKEIAQMTGTTEAAIKMRVRRAFDTMRDALGAVLLAILAAGGA